MSEAYLYIYKIILLGDGGVGKTSLIQKYVHGSFNLNTCSTLGVVSTTKSVLIDNDRILLDIWDTAGQEKYRSMNSCFFRGCKAAIIVYDIANENSFQNIEYWIQQVREFEGDSVKVLLVGNKADLEDNRKISQKIGLSIASDQEMLFIETSCLNNYNIEKAFQVIAECLHKDQMDFVNPVDDDISGLNGISILSHSLQLPKNKKKCC